jgi:hypothetical protein
LTSTELNSEVAMINKSHYVTLLGSLLFIAVIVNTSIAYVNEYMLDGALGGDIGQLSFWLVLGLSVVISITFRRRYVPFVLILIVLIIILRATRALAPGMSKAYGLSFSFLIAFASAVFYMKNQKAYELWLKIFVTINLFLLVLQLLGVTETVHMWNTYFIGFDNVLRVELGPTLFVSKEDLMESYFQLRPPGLFYSNAVTAGFIIMALGHRIGGAIRKVTLYDLGLIASVLFCSAKICFLFLFVAAVSRYFLCDTTEKAARRNLLLVIPLVILVYYMFFPGVFLVSYSKEKFIDSIGVRVTDILLSHGIEEIPLIEIPLTEDNLLPTEDVLVNKQLYEEETDIGNLTGYKTLVIMLPFFFISWILLKKRLKRITVPRQFIFRAQYLTFAYLFCFLAIPILGMTLHPFLFGPALIVFFYIDSARSYDKMKNVSLKIGLNTSEKFSG